MVCLNSGGHGRVERVLDGLEGVIRCMCVERVRRPCCRSGRGGRVDVGGVR